MVNVTVTDGDGSTAGSSFTVTIDDDTPVAGDLTGGTYVEGSTGNVVDADAALALGIDAGADGLEGTLQDISFSGGIGTLSIDGAGKLIYDAPEDISNNDEPVETTFN